MLLENYLPAPGMNDTESLVLNALGGKHGVVPGEDWVRWRQPYLDSKGRACLAVRALDGGYTKNDASGGEKKPLIRAYKIQDLLNMGLPVPVTVNAATMLREAWIELERTVQRAARERLGAADDLMANARVNIDGYRKLTLEYRAMSDAGTAYVDMDPATDGTTDLPLHITRSLPLPVTHSDFGFTDREVEVSRGSGLPYDDTMAEQATRRVMESIEDQTLGNVTGVTYGTQSSGYGAHTGTSTVYGYRNFPQRLTKTNFTTPTTTNGPTTYVEVLAAINQLRAQFFYGPWTLYHSTDWSTYMDTPFTTSGGNHPSETLRTMLMKIPDIRAVKRLDRLTATFTLLFVQFGQGGAQMVNGMPLRTVSWSIKGGLEHRWKVMVIRVPRMLSDYNSRNGILHGTTA